MALNAEQKAFMEYLEEELKDRYTEDDPDYKRILDKEIELPPIVEPWDTDRSGRNDRWNNHRGEQNRNQRGYGRGYGNYRNYDRRRNDGNEGNRNSYGDRRSYGNNGGYEGNRSSYGDRRNYGNNGGYEGNRSSYGDRRSYGNSGGYEGNRSNFQRSSYGD